MFSFYVIESSLHRLPWRTADPILHVIVDVILDVDDRPVQEHILLSILTTRSRSDRPCPRRSGLASCRALQASTIAAHSIAEPRAIA